MNKKSTHEDVSDKLSSLLNIKFKAQLKDSPIVFDNFLQVKNLITGNENYVIIFQREESVLKFKDKEEFLTNFIDYIETKIKEFEVEFEELNRFESRSMGIKYDENEVYMCHERIGHGQSKLNQIREKLIKMKL